MSYQRTVYDRLSSFLGRFLPKMGRVGYSNQFVQNQIRDGLVAARAVSPDGEISANRVATVMRRNHGVIMPDELDDDSYVGVELGESE